MEGAREVHARVRLAACTLSMREREGERGARCLVEREEKKKGERERERESERERGARCVGEREEKKKGERKWRVCVV